MNRAIRVAALVLVLSAITATPAAALGDSWAGNNDNGTPTTRSVDEHGTVTVGAQETSSVPGSGGPVAGPQGPAGPVAGPAVADPCAEPIAPDMRSWCVGAATAAALANLGTVPDPQRQQTTQATQTTVRRALLEMQLPTADPHIGPDPEWNEWKMAAIGFPLWFWTDTPTQHATTTHDGITITMTATSVSTTFDFGDHQSATCTTATPYDRAATKPGTPSPDCGHTYTTIGTMTVTARTRWLITYTANGTPGTLLIERTGTRQIPVGELETIIVG